MRRQNRRDSCYRKLLEDKAILTNPSLLKKKQNEPNSSNLRTRNSVSLAKLNSIPSVEIGSKGNNCSSSFRLKKKASSGKLATSEKQKLIFLKGKTYSKKDIFDTINYFKTISDNEEKVGIKDFFKRFERKTFLKKQLSSIFKLLDHEQKG